MFYINGTKNEKDFETLDKSGMLQKTYNDKNEIEAVCKLKDVDYDSLIIINDKDSKNIMKG
jgi:hypothetical protein